MPSARLEQSQPHTEVPTIAQNQDALPADHLSGRGDGVEKALDRFGGSGRLQARLDDDVTAKQRAHDIVRQVTPNDP